MKITVAVILAGIAFPTWAQAQLSPECRGFGELALEQRKAAVELLKQGDTLRASAEARFKIKASFQRQIQQAFDKILEAQAKMTASLAELDRGVAQKCEPSMVELRDDAKDDLEVIVNTLATMRQAAPEIGVKLKG